MSIETEQDLAHLKVAGRVVARVLQQMIDQAEPFLSSKSRIVTQQEDGWTLSGAKGNLSAQ